MCLFSQKCGVEKDPVDYHTKELSDHAPLLGLLPLSPASLKKMKKARPEWCRHPLFKERFDNLFRVAELESVDIDERIR